MFADGCPMNSHSRQQSVVATSSGVAEFYAACSGAEELLGFRAVYEFIGYSVSMTLQTDSSAEKGISQRLGLGRVKHLEIRSLWLQSVVRDNQITIEKVLGTENCADLGSKILGITGLTQTRYDCGVRLLDRTEEDEVTATLRAVRSTNAVPKIAKVSYGS